MYITMSNTSLQDLEKKIKNIIINIPGTIPNAKNAQLLISSGIPSFDNLIDGGLAVGTILLIEESEYGNYGKLMLKYFLAEGVLNKHSLFVASQDVDPKKLIAELPAPLKCTTDPYAKVSKEKEDKMTIAWRYQHLSTNEEEKNKQFGHFYNLAEVMDLNVIDKINVEYWNSPQCSLKTPETFAQPAYHDLLQKIQNHITKGLFSVKATPEHRTVLRVGIYGLGSPLWLADRKASEGLHRDRDLDMFLYCLRTLMRSAFAVAMVVIPSDLIREDSVKRCIHSSDTAIKLKSFLGTKHADNPSLSNYNGLVHITKLPAINTLSSAVPDTLDLAFKLRRKCFVIEKLHLPPELQETTEREQDEMPAFSCSSKGMSKLDF